MGKKQGQEGAQRTKGNVKPSSSAKAAEMLQQISSNLASYSFSSDITPLGVGTLMEEQFDSNLDGDFRAALRKLYKKDTLTKLKALDEIKSLIDTKSEEECITITTYWAKCYSKLTLDSERKIRETCQQTHEKLCLKIKKSIAPSLKAIMPYWILAQADTFIPAGRLATRAFKGTFNEAKQPEVVYFARDEILNVLYDYLIVQTVKSLSDMKTTSEDEAQQKYETVISISMKGLELFLRSYVTTLEKQAAASSAQSSLEKLEKLLTNQKFWKFAKDTSVKIRCEFFQLLSNLVDILLTNETLQGLEASDPLIQSIRSQLQSKLVPLVFYSCDEDNNSCAFYIWQAILKCAKHICTDDAEKQTSFWTLMNTKKTFMPKLIALLRHHGNGSANSQNVALVYVSLLPVISRLNSVLEASEERLEFYKDLFTRLNDGIAREISIKTRYNDGTNRNYMIDAFFDCSQFCINQFVKNYEEKDSEKFVAFFQQVTLKYVYSIFDAYMENATISTSTSGFEVKLRQFMSNVIESEHQASPLSQDIRQQFWRGLNASLLSRLDTASDSLELALNNLKTTKKVCDLFGPFWAQHSQTDKATSLLHLVQLIFSKFLNKFHSLMESGELASTSESVVFVYLQCMSRLCRHFMHKSLLDSILAMYCETSIESCMDKLLGQIDRKRLLLADTADSKNALTFGLVDLYLLLKSPQDPNELLLKLDEFFIKSNAQDVQQLDNLFDYHLLEKGESMDTHLLSWFLRSEAFSVLFSTKYLGHFVSCSNEDQSKKMEYIGKFMELAIKSNSYPIRTNEFYEAVVQSLVQLIGQLSNSESCLLDAAHLDQLVDFSMQILFSREKCIREQKTIWVLLIDLFKLKYKLASWASKLNSIVSRLTSRLFDLILEKEDSCAMSYEASDFGQLILFAIKNVNESLDLADYLNNNTILFGIVDQFIKVLQLRQLPVGPLFERVLFRTRLSDKLSLRAYGSIFKSLSFQPNDSFNRDLLLQLYMTERTNYIYSQHHREILTAPETASSSSTQWLRQIDYTLKLLSRYFSLADSTRDMHASRQSQSGFLTSNPTNVYFLVLCALTVTKLETANLIASDANYELTNSLVHSVRSHLNQLLYETKFLATMVTGVELNAFVQALFPSLGSDDSASTESSFQLELNNLSYLFIELVDSRVEGHMELTRSLSEFSLSLSEALLADRRTSGQEMLVKHLLYDIPFAKYSVLDTIGKVNNELAYYYTLFDSLVESVYEELLGQLKVFKLNGGGGGQQLDVANLSAINFKLGLLIKYSQIFMDLVATNSVFQTSPVTCDFIAHKFSKFLLKLIDLFIDLKDFDKANKYLFYYNFEVTVPQSESCELAWQKFSLLNNMSRLFKLLFTDYSLMGSPAEQLSQFLQHKHWDFVLCFSSALVQKLNSLEFPTAFGDRERTTGVELLATDLFSMVSLLVGAMTSHVRDNLSGRYPRSVHSEWTAFFSREIFDPALCLYVRLAEHYTALHSQLAGQQSNYLFVQSLKSSKLGLVACLSRLVYQVPVERLLLNDLEVKLNVFDADEQLAIRLTDKLKTVVNHLVPNLKHQIKSVQISSYKVLQNIMRTMSSYYEIKSAAGDDEEEEAEAEMDEESTGSDSGSGRVLNIFESLPHSLRETLCELSAIFVDLKRTVAFDQNILVTKLSRRVGAASELLDEELNCEDLDDGEAGGEVLGENSLKLRELCHDSNNKFMAYLLVNSLILDMFATENLEFKVRLVNNLREVSFSDTLMNCLFRLMPSFKHSSMRLFSASGNPGGDAARMDWFVEPATTDESFQNRHVQLYACRVYKSALKFVPAMLRDWWNIQPKGTATSVDKYTIKYVSAVLLEEEIRDINRAANLIASPVRAQPIVMEVKNTEGVGPAKKTIVIEDDEESSIKIRGMLSSREIVSTYKMKELNMELIIQLPANYPLGVVEVSSVRRLGVSEQEWRNWLIQLTTYLTHQNGSILQSLQIWKKNVDKKFHGVEECCICYAVIHGTNYQLPKKKCRTCKKLFHSICLYKWFESSNKSSCPLCRNLF